MVVMQWMSAFVLALTATLAANVALLRHRRSAWPVALSFALFFVYAVLDLKPDKFSPSLLHALFLLASLAMLWAVLLMVYEPSHRPDPTPPPPPGPPGPGSAKSTGESAAQEGLKAPKK
jgi:hypothetical protein